jgi:hypothetical protein
LLAKHFRSSEWQTLSIPKNRSAEFNKFLTEKGVADTVTINRMEAPAEFLKQAEKRMGKCSHPFDLC